MSNFACIGLRVSDQASYEAMVDALLDGAVEDVPASDGVSHLRWTDPSGASVAFHLHERTLGCVTPFFAPADGLTTWRARTTAPAPDPECVHCSGAECDLLDASGALQTRAAVQWLHFLPDRAFLAEPQVFTLEVAAFARRTSFFADAEAFRDGQASYWARPDGTQPTLPDGKPMRLAEVSFMPSGLFAGPGSSMTERARVTFSGLVERSESLVNGVTQDPFQRVRIRTLPGLVDTVFDPARATGPIVPGSIAFVDAWLVGRPQRPAHSA